MPEAYGIAHLTVDDPDAYEACRQANGPALARYGGRFIVRGGPHKVVEGRMRPRSVVIEFASRADADACYRSPEYQAALALRRPVSSAGPVIVDGWDDPGTSG